MAQQDLALVDAAADLGMTFFSKTCIPLSTFLSRYLLFRSINLIFDLSQAPANC
jgi:hypothetical protein